MGRYNILHLEIPSDRKVELASRFDWQIKIINKTSAIKDYFKLSEVSYGYKSGDKVYYFDYPYSSAKGKIVDAVNSATRGELPSHSRLPDKDIYKDLDIKISLAFEDFNNKKGKLGYVLYEFVPNDYTTPTIINIETNIETDIEDFNEDMLSKYFFVIYHCTELKYNLEQIFLDKPKLDKNLCAKEKQYLLYFNSKKDIKLANGREAPEVITCAFISTEPVNTLPDIILYIENNIEYIYEAIINQLRYVAMHSREYHEMQSALYEFENEKKQSKLKYNILHPLKYRLGNLLQSGNYFLELCDDLSISEEFKYPFSIFIKDIYGVQKFPELAYLSFFSSVHTLTETYNEIKSNSFRFSTTTPLNFSNLIKEIFNKTKSIRENLHFKCQLNMEQSSNFSIIPYFHIGNNEYVRLFDCFYEAIIFEIINNFLDHSDDDNNGVKTLSIKAEDENSIVFSNKLKVNSELTEFDKLTTGGLAFVFNTLNTTESGLITHNIINGSYEVKLQLEGLSWQQIK